MIIIFEGPDNVGKTTQINKLKKFLSKVGKFPIYLHFSALEPKNKEYYEEYYLTIFNTLSNTIDKNIIYLIDRFHLGELVYGKLYRNYKSNVLEIEKIDSILIMFIDEPKNLIKRDDGKSFTTNIELKNKEIDLFIKNFKKSKIKYKLLININNKSENAIFEEILNYILPILGVNYDDISNFC